MDHAWKRKDKKNIDDPVFLSVTSQCITPVGNTSGQHQWATAVGNTSEWVTPVSG